MLRDDALFGRIEADWRSAGLDARRVALCTYAERLTRTPSEVRREDVDALRAVGFEDRDVLQIVELVGYYAFANRIADGLGITLEPWVDEPPSA